MANCCGIVIADNKSWKIGRHQTLHNGYLVYGILNSILWLVYNDANLIEMTLNTSHGRILSLLMAMKTSCALLRA